MGVGVGVGAVAGVGVGVCVVVGMGVGVGVLSAPYGVPEWMPEVLEELSRRTCEPNPVKESVQWTFSEFKKTHQDAWQETRAAFTSEQWENISIGMELAPSYIV